MDVGNFCFCHQKVHIAVPFGLYRCDLTALQLVTAQAVRVVQYKSMN